MLYYGRECCIYCTLTKDVKQSSDATATTSGFIVRNYSKNELLEGSTDQVFVQKEEINQVFDDSFLSSSSTGKLFDDVTCFLVKLKEKQASREDIEVICGMICSGQETLMQMKLNYETPYNEWLYKLLMKKLNQYNFIIYERNNCPRPPAPINEYINCKSDILLYHECGVESVEALHVTLESLRLDDQNDLPDNINIKAGVAELKVNLDDIASGENECFLNMCGEAAKLVSSVLCKGTLVKNVTIYGIVVAAHNHRQAQLLKLKINYFESICIFERCRRRAPFLMKLSAFYSSIKLLFHH